MGGHLTLHARGRHLRGPKSAVLLARASACGRTARAPIAAGCVCVTGARVAVRGMRADGARRGPVALGDLPHGAAGASCVRAVRVRCAVWQGRRGELDAALQHVVLRCNAPCRAAPCGVAPRALGCAVRHDRRRARRPRRSAVGADRCDGRAARAEARARRGAAVRRQDEPRRLARRRAAQGPRHQPPAPHARAHFRCFVPDRSAAADGRAGGRGRRRC